MSTDCENLLKRFLVLNPAKRGTLEVGISGIPFFFFKTTTCFQRTMNNAATVCSMCPLCILCEYEWVNTEKAWAAAHRFRVAGHKTFHYSLSYSSGVITVLQCSPTISKSIFANFFYLYTCAFKKHRLLFCEPSAACQANYNDHENKPSPYTSPGWAFLMCCSYKKKSQENEQPYCRSVFHKVSKL